MAAESEAIFARLKHVFDGCHEHLQASVDDPSQYTLVGRIPSPLAQHKGEPMFFSQIKVGKAYVSLHLLPLYKNEALTAMVPPNLKKRMQGQACFNFKTMPEPELLDELKLLVSAALQDFRAKRYL